MKSLLLTATVTLGLTVATMAQNLPNYVPVNGLIGWWPFNGNANDESGNGLNGEFNNGDFTLSPFDSCASFNGSNLLIIPNSPNFNTDTFTFSIRVKLNSHLGHNEIQFGIPGNSLRFSVGWDPNIFYLFPMTCSGGYGVGQNYPATPINTSNWYHMVFVNNGINTQYYLDGLFMGQSDMLTPLECWNPSMNLYLGGDIGGGAIEYFNGYMDEFGFWNRTLTQQEISDLFNAVNCANNSTISPQNNLLAIGSTATFNATTSDPNPSYVWQSNFGQGFQTLNDIENYSGTNTATLNIANVQLANHNQPIRVITTSGECIDTSNVAIISIVDTCINTITDTTFITVTDTLIINSTITSLSPPNNSNTIKVFPNPTNDHITIDYGNFIIMTGYQLQIENSLGQQVFQTDITQQSDYLNLSNWGGNGLYFVHIIDSQGNTIDIRKIVLQ